MWKLANFKKPKLNLNASSNWHNDTMQYIARCYLSRVAAVATTTPIHEPHVDVDVRVYVSLRIRVNKQESSSHKDGRSSWTRTETRGVYKSLRYNRNKYCLYIYIYSQGQGGAFLIALMAMIAILMLLVKSLLLLVTFGQLTRAQIC